MVGKKKGIRAHCQKQTASSYENISSRATTSRVFFVHMFLAGNNIPEADCTKMRQTVWILAVNMVI